MTHTIKTPYGTAYASNYALAVAILIICGAGYIIEGIIS